MPGGWSRARLRHIICRRGAKTNDARIWRVSGPVRLRYWTVNNHVRPKLIHDDVVSMTNRFAEWDVR